MYLWFGSIYWCKNLSPFLWLSPPASTLHSSPARAARLPASQSRALLVLVQHSVMVERQGAWKYLNVFLILIKLLGLEMLLRNIVPFLQLGHDVCGGNAEVIAGLVLGLGAVLAQGAALGDAVKHWSVGGGH